MREDQAKRLENLEERLVEVVIADADPTNWTGQGMLLGDMDKAVRGDAAWCRKTAALSVALTMQVRRLLADYRQPGDVPPPPYPDDAETAIAAAEAEAEKMIQRVTGGKPRR